jgi:hypothetical protein
MLFHHQMCDKKIIGLVIIFSNNSIIALVKNFFYLSHS